MEKITNELAPFKRDLLEKQIFAQLFKVFSAFFEGPGFIKVFTRAKNLTLS